jgi:hypothetical protein
VFFKRFVNFKNDHLTKTLTTIIIDDKNCKKKKKLYKYRLLTIENNLSFFLKGQKHSFDFQTMWNILTVV